VQAEPHKLVLLRGSSVEVIEFPQDGLPPGSSVSTGGANATPNNNDQNDDQAPQAEPSDDSAPSVPDADSPDLREATSQLGDALEID
jgi:hypothetical protein